MHLFAVLLSVAVAAQQPPKSPRPPAEQTVIRTTTQEVLLDLVVRDKKGKLIRDLRPEEIEVYDEGSPQKINAFRLVTGTAAAGLGSEAAASVVGPKQLDPMRQLRLISLVFEGLDNEARRLVRNAAMDFLREALEQNVYVSVFVIDERLRVLQPFTNDTALLRKVVEKATGSHYPQFVAESEAIRKELEAVQGDVTAAAQGAATNLPGRGNPGGGGIGPASAASRMAQATLNILNFEEALTRSQQSRSSLFSLLALVKEQAALPGRKTVVYFTRGLQVPENMVEHLKSTIAAANRAGVSVYGVDARGLTLDSQNASSVSMLQSAVSASRTQQLEGDERGVTPEQVKVFDTAMNSIHANTQQALGNLATSTGGFLVSNTNDFRDPFRQIHEDVMTYYELAYSPQIEQYDGRFRRLMVKVNRPDAKVQSRSGYFALPPNQDSVFAYEMPLFNALNANPLPRQVSYQVAALRFHGQDARQEHTLAIEVPLAGVAATEDVPNKKYTTRISVLALVKNQNGEVVERFSRDFPFDVPLDRIEEFRKRQFLNTYQVSLPPGRYTVESAVMDREANKAAARKTSVVVAPPRAAIDISSISLIRRLDPQSADAASIDPFHYQGNRVVPRLDAEVQNAPGGGLSFYFVVYPQASEASKPQLTLELSKDGQPLGAISPQLPEPNERGAIPYIASFPLEKFPAGQYELRAVVRQGAGAAEEYAVFKVNQ
jgi:VWFA-related protein